MTGIKSLKKTAYPSDGKITIEYNGNKKYIALRIPDWCREYKLNKKHTVANGYAIIEADGGTIELELNMPVETIRANSRVHACAGKIAVMRGPVVYCAEGVDNGSDLANVHIDTKGSFSLGEEKFMLPTIKTKGYINPETKKLYTKATEEYEEIPLTLIPYYAFANRGTSQMYVWMLQK